MSSYNKASQKDTTTEDVGGAVMIATRDSLITEYFDIVCRDIYSI